MHRSHNLGANQHTVKPRKRRTRAEIERAKRKSESARRHHLRTKHGMTLGEYEALKAWQNGVCFICGRATGKTKNLAVDHDHRKCSSHTPDISCRECWRGLLCGSCNDILGHARDAIAFFHRCIDYLENPPAQRWLRKAESDGRSN
jgi:Recombination endonuclease VII